MVERRKFSPEFKARVVLELISGKKGLMEAIREYGINDTVLSRSKNELLERAAQVFEQPKPDGQDFVDKLYLVVGNINRAGY